ncbi:MAG: response regulator [Candidatus Riflebacteria bacterium]|nr:response regulator [Candidatus Riflebacteria bacterium]
MEEKNSRAEIQGLKSHIACLEEFIQVNEQAWLVEAQKLESVLSELEQKTRDLTRSEEEARLAREAAEKANRTKSDFLASMSHEIRTPMNAIIGMSHLALKSEKDQKQRNYLEKILFSGKSLLLIINDILDFSKIEAGKLEIESVEFSLDEVLDGVANMVGLQAEQKGLEVLFDFEPRLPKLLVGDPLRLGQILTNLANNAVKFTDHGEVIISILCLAEDVANEKISLQFCVKDTGIGMTSEQMSHLFKSFSQLDASTTRKYGGSGLGLCIAKALVEKMGGTMWVESTPGEGSKFFFRIDYQYKFRKLHPVEKFPKNLRGMHALVVDDNQSCSEILKSQLESFSFKVETASDGFDGLEKFRQSLSSPDGMYELVLMDWNMPGLNGFEATKKIKKEICSDKFPQVILVTGFGHVEIDSESANYEVDSALIKPVKPSVLFDTIMTLFGQEISEKGKIRFHDDLAGKENSFIGRKALVVEDNKINQEVARGFLEGVGFQVEIAENGSKGVEKFLSNEKEFHVVFMDIQMPVMDGYEATRMIRIRAKSRNFPIIAMTAHALKEERERCLKAGMSDYLSKPIDPNALFAVLKKWVEPGNETPVEGQKKSSIDYSLDRKGFSSILNVINLEEALRRIRGDTNHFKKILTAFKNDFKDVLEKINDAVIRRNCEETANLLHSLKGVAGNISANHLFETVREFEEQLKRQEQSDYSDNLSRLEKHFTDVMIAIQRLEDDKEIQKDSTKNQRKVKSDEIDKDVLTGLFSEFHRTLSKNNISAEQYHEKIKKVLENSEFESEISGIENCIEKLDYKGALQFSQKLATKIGIEFKGEGEGNE